MFSKNDNSLDDPNIHVFYQSSINGMRLKLEHLNQVVHIIKDEDLLTTFGCVIFRRSRASRTELWGA